jgi:DNA-damage-inducible protein J
MSDEMTSRTIKVNKELIEQAEKLFYELGLDTESAFEVFLHSALKQMGVSLEFKLYIPNAETIAALEEAERISRDPNTKRYSSASEMLAEIMAEIGDHADV